MTFTKRIFFFFLVNIAMVVTISIVLAILNVGPYMSRYGLNYGSLAAFCLVWGMMGAFISLAMSRIMAKWMMGIQLVSPESPGKMGEVARTVHQLAKAARLPAMPEVGIYESPEVNAFATGPTKSRSLVAVSTGLLNLMDRDEVEGVLAHEVAHIANGDMVTMTLIQGVINALVMFLARIAAFAVSTALSSRNSDRDRPNPFMQFMLVIVFEIVFGLFGMLVVAFFSRWREFRADRGGAMLGGRDKMRAALQRLRNYSERVETAHPSLAAFKINGGRGGLMALFSTHPPLEERIRRLETQ